MPDSLARIPALVVATTALCPLLATTAAAQDTQRPRVIVLGFDGVDHGMAERWMAEGELPNLKALAERGSFSRLETTNPAESAVSWTTFGRGLAPGHTDMFGFVSRKEGDYLPELRFMEMGEAPLERFYDPPSGSRLTAALIGLGAGLLLGLALGRGRPVPAVVLALLGAAAGGLIFGAASVEAPETVPTLMPVAEGEPLWQRLDEGGVRVKGVLVPMSTPINPLEHGRMSGGLGVPDAMGNPIGSYYLFSSSPRDVPTGNVRKTDSQAKVIRLRQRDGVLAAELPGPPDVAQRSAVESELEDIEAALRAEPTPAERTELVARRRELRAERDAGFETRLEVRVRRVEEPRAVEVTVGGETLAVAEGQWSGWLPLRFPVPWPLDGAALCRFRVLEAGDTVRLFFSPLSFDPREMPAHLRVEHPHGFSARVAEDAGLYDTTGWACISNPLKDREVSEDVFLEHIGKLTEDRSRVLYSELAKDDWDFYFTLFGETDRVQHMMYRLIDEENPMYDAELAERYGDSVLDVYRAMDEIVGEVMRRFLDDRTQLMVVSDHGFTSFRRQVSLNTWLMEEGYLVPKLSGSEPAELLRRLSGIQSDYLLYMDRDRSKAFALGLGKIYINLRGREPNGIVGPDEYDVLCTEIRDKLLALTDPQDGAKAVNRVWRNTELYDGPYAAADADLTVGFAEHYRVSWATTTGGFEAEVIHDNDSKWSGGHASNDPDVVPGVLFSSRPLVPDQRPAVVDMAPTILALFGLPTGPTDGRALEFE